MPGRKNYFYLYRITIVAALGGFLFGYDTAVVSGAVNAIRNYFIFPLSANIEQAEKVILGYRITVCASVFIIGLAVSGMLLKLFDKKKALILISGLFISVVIFFIWFFGKPAVYSETTASALTGFAISSALIGCIIGGSGAGFISMVWGRKNGLIVSGILFFISGLGAAFPDTLNFSGTEPLVSFMLYRIIGGIGIGLASMLSPMYIAEVAPAELRGRLVSWNQMAIVLGMLVVYFVNWSISRFGDDQWNIETGWRYMFLSGVFPSAIFLFLLFFVPETPRYLVMRNKDDGALRVLRKTVGEKNAQTILKDIRNTMVEHSAPWLSFGGLIIIIAVLLSAFQQLTGINVVLYYAPQIFQNTGLQLDVSLMQTILVGIVNIVFTIVAITTVDRFGRKPLLLTGGIIMAVAMFSIGLSFYSGRMGLLTLVFILIFIAGFAMSWGPVMWVMLSEIFPNSIRGAMSIATAMVWITDLIVSWSFPVMDENKTLISLFNHGFSYWLYGLICIAAVAFVWKMVPETRGKSLEQIEKFWDK